MAARVTVLVVLVALAVIFFTGNVGAAGGDEGAALLALKAGFVDPLGVLDDWKTASPHCRWTGVRCNAAGLVDGLDLSGRNLSGSLSGDLLRFPALAVLNISSNSFAATLPKSLSPLSSLQVFDVSQNSFEGGFPAGLGSCADLVAVNGSGNNFVGPLPVDLANATSLESIDMRGAFFSGHIPAAYGRLAKLRFLGLSGNNIGGKIPPELGDMEALESLIIGYNELEGPIPPELGNLARLQYLETNPQLMSLSLEVPRVHNDHWYGRDIPVLPSFISVISTQATFVKEERRKTQHSHRKKLQKRGDQI